MCHTHTLDREKEFVNNNDISHECSLAVITALSEAVFQQDTGGMWGMQFSDG